MIAEDSFHKCLQGQLHLAEVNLLAITYGLFVPWGSILWVNFLKVVDCVENVECLIELTRHTVSVFDS